MHRDAHAGWATDWGPDLVAGWAGEAADNGISAGDAAFDNSSHVPGAGALLRDLSARSAAMRSAMGARLLAGIAYGPHPRERLDLFVPHGDPVGLLVFLHGGYWMMGDRADWSVLAQGALAHGVAVAVPSYPLTPEVSLAVICCSAASAVACAADRIAGPVVVAGHSAGGHLAARLACAPDLLPPHLAPRLRRIVPISGLHDLRPLMQAREMNRKLQLNAAICAAVSPALLTAKPGLPVRAAVGSLERPELIRQSNILGRAWPECCTVHIVPGEDHFSIVAGLIDPKNLIIAEILSGFRNSDCVN